MGMTLNALYALDNDILGSLFFPDLYVWNSDPNHLEDEYFLQGRIWHGQVLFPNILLQCGHFETLHNSPDTFKHELEMWSKMRTSVWSDMLRTTVQKYVLTHNYDRTEEWTEERATTESGEDSRSGSGSGKTTDNGTNSATESGNGTTTHTTSGSRSEETSVSAYNSASHQPKEKTVGEDSGTNNGTSTQSREHSGTDSRNGTSEHEQSESGTFTKTGGDKFTRSVKAYGNIGVTTAQQMIKEERELVTLNMVQYIVDDFKNYFCVMVY